MKVLIVPSWYATEDRPLDGVFFAEQAKALAAAGADVRIIYPDLRFRLKKLRRGIFEAPGPVKTLICRRRSAIPFSERARRPQIARMLEALYRRTEREWGRPDLVHLHSCRIGIETLALCGRHDLPLIYTEHYSAVMGAMSRPLREAFERTAARCERAVAVSEALANVIRQVRPDTLVIPNMVDTAVFRDQRPAEREHARGERFVFAALGSYIPVKGYDLLLRAFALALGEMEGARLIVAGGGDGRGALKSLAASLGVGSHVELRGPVARADVPAFFGETDCVVCSSHVETFGMTLAEALACGRPVISTRCGGPSDIVRPGCGLLVPADDPPALARAMARMYRERSSYDPAQIRNFCVENFGVSAVADRLLGVYRQALLRGPEHPAPTGWGKK